MLKWTTFLSCLAVLVIAAGLSGCGPAEDHSATPAEHSHDEDADHVHGEDADHVHGEDADHVHGEDADHVHGEDADHTHESTDIPEGLAELSSEDRAAAVAQVICPVSGEKLGTMGAPVKVSVKGREVFLCCEGCRKSLLEDPDKYLAKLDGKS